MLYCDVLGEPSFMELAYEQGAYAGLVAASYVSEFPDAQTALRCLRAKFRDNAPDWDSFGRPAYDSPVREPHQRPAPYAQDVVDYYGDLDPTQVEAVTAEFDRSRQAHYEDAILDSARRTVTEETYERLGGGKSIGRDEYEIAWEVVKYGYIDAPPPGIRRASPLVTLLENAVVED